MENNKYFLYARKSSESDERQVQSLDDQIKIMTNKAKSYWIEIVDIFKESMSAKAPWRYKFSEMISRINNNEAKWIITWKLDRLSRNPIDSWTIQYMLQTWVLDKVITNDREYKSYDSWLLMSVETWMANQYILDLVKNVRRWLDSKYEKWIRPTSVPIWYLNDIANRTIVTDLERVHIVRKLWELMLTWSYSIKQVIRIANNELWLRRPIRRNKWGWELTSSSWQRMFRNIFYTGYFYYKWELVKWIHEQIISIEEFNRVQTLLSKWWKSKPIKRDFSYTWMIDCWICGCRITWEVKNKYIKATQETKEYIYYHCTKKKKDICCNQWSIKIEDLEQQISSILKSIEIEPEFKNWVFATIKENYRNEFETRINIYENLNKTIISEEKRLKNLTDMLLDELIDKETFTLKKNEIQEKIISLNDKKNNVDLKGQKSQTITESIFDFTINVVESFNSWNIQRKKDILNSLGKNFVLKDWILALELEPWYKVIQENISEAKMEVIELEPTKKVIRFLQTDDLMLSKFKWWVRRDSNPRPSP